jgi:hypothetical protein
MMSFLLYAVLGYWGLCALLAVGSLFIDCPDLSREEKIGWVLNIRSPHREIIFLIGTLAVALVAPVLIPWCFTSSFLEDRRREKFFTWLKRTHRDNIYEKIHPVKLPKAARKYFEEHTPELLDLGFCELGRYILKPEPAHSFGCCFQSADGRTVGTLGYMFDSSYYSFNTLFANGLALETASVEETPELASVNESRTYRAIFSPNLSIAETFVLHEEAIAKLESEFNTRALAFEPEQFCDVLTYENRTYAQLMYETGKHDAPPPAAVLPTPIRGIDDSVADEAVSFAWEPGDQEIATV